MKSVETMELHAAVGYKMKGVAEAIASFRRALAERDCEGAIAALDVVAERLEGWAAAWAAFHASLGGLAASGLSG